MFVRHSTDFTARTATPALPVPAGAMCSISAQTALETPTGWAQAADLHPGAQVASLDGGFVTLDWVRRALPTPCVHVPARALGNCSDLVLPADARVGQTAPAHMQTASTDTLSLPLRAMIGLRGIHPVQGHAPGCITIGLDSEEMIWAQTGLLIHARPHSAPYFHMLSQYQTRALFAPLPGQPRTGMCAA